MKRSCFAFIPQFPRKLFTTKNQILHSSKIVVDEGQNEQDVR